MEHTFSLSRAHKYVERLHAEHDRIFEQLSSTLSPITVHVVGDEDKADKQADRFKTLLESSDTISQALMNLRTAIAAKNGQIGLHEKLVQRAAISREIKALEAVLNQGVHYSGSAMEKDQVIPYMNRIAHMTSMQQVRVKVLSEALQETLEAKISKLKRQEIGVGDEINDMNGEKITVELDAEINTLIGRE